MYYLTLKNKKKAANKLSNLFNFSKFVIILNNKNLNMEIINQLRFSCSKVKAHVLLLKNTITKKVLKKKNEKFQILMNVLTDQNLAIFILEENELDVIKILTNLNLLNDNFFKIMYYKDFLYNVSDLTYMIHTDIKTELVNLLASLKKSINLLGMILYRYSLIKEKNL